MYAWDLDTCVDQAPLLVLVDMEWLLKTEDQVTVNKLDPVDPAIWDVEPDMEHILLDLGGTTENVKVPGTVYTPRCLTPSLLMGLQLPYMACGILQNIAKRIRISNASAPSRDFLWVRLLTDYVGNLDPCLDY